MTEFSDVPPQVVEGVQQIAQPPQSETPGFISATQPKPETTSPHELIESEGKRIASGILSERQRIIAERDPKMVPGDAEKSYDYAMRLNILRSLEQVKAGEPTNPDAQREQQRQIELQGIRKAQVDLIADHYRRVTDKGESYHKSSQALVEDIASVGSKVNLFRLDNVVRQVLHEEILKY